MNQGLRQLRDAHSEDAHCLFQAEQQIAGAFKGLFVSLPNELTEKSVQDRIQLLSDGRGKYLVAEVNDQIVGHASLVPMALQQIAHVFRLDMCVHQGHWRQGHGQALLRALITWALQYPTAHKIELQVRSENTAAIALYQSAGFIEEGRFHDRIRLQDGRFMDDICMALILKQP